MLREALHGEDDGGADAAPPPPPAFESFDLDGVAKKIAEAKNIIVMAGAGACVPTAHALHVDQACSPLTQCTSIPVDVTARASTPPVGCCGAWWRSGGRWHHRHDHHKHHQLQQASPAPSSRMHAVADFCLRSGACMHADRVLTYAHKRTLQTRFSCAARVCLPFLDYCCAWPCDCAKRCIASCCNRGHFPGHADTHSPMQRPRWQFENASSLHLKLANFLLTQPPTPCCAMPTHTRSSYTV
jgi:hypothetical protein